MPVKVLLETRDVNVEAEDLSGEGMLGGQGFGAPDALLPEGFQPRADYGAFGQPEANRARSQSVPGKSRLPIPRICQRIPAPWFTNYLFRALIFFCSPGGIYEAHPWKTCRSQKGFERSRRNRRCRNGSARFATEIAEQRKRRDVSDAMMEEFKTLVTEVLTPHASAILLDPELGIARLQTPRQERRPAAGL